MFPFLMFVLGLCEGQLLIFIVNRFVAKKRKVRASTSNKITTDRN